MSTSRIPTCLAACVFLALTARPSRAQQTPANPYAAACGQTKVNYNVKHVSSAAGPAQPPPGKALVYIVESMLDYPLITKKVNIGLDGSWLGATDADTHMRLTIDPGVHHFCAEYQGHAAGMDDEGHTLLLRLDAQVGQIYYLRYHALFAKDSAGIAFFEPVDEDEGLLLVQRTDEATSTLKN